MPAPVLALWHPAAAPHWRYARPGRVPNQRFVAGRAAALEPATTARPLPRPGILRPSPPPARRTATDLRPAAPTPRIRRRSAGLQAQRAGARQGDNGDGERRAEDEGGQAADLELAPLER